MADRVLEAFLSRQWQEGKELARQSDLLELEPMDPIRPPRFWVARFYCRGLVRASDGSVKEASGFEVGLSFPSDYLRRAEPSQVLTWLGPPEVWHPNIRPPAICVGRIAPGTALVDLVYQCFEILTYHNWAPHDALNPEASQWARNHQDRFPVDRRPLKRKTLCLGIRNEAKRP